MFLRLPYNRQCIPVVGIFFEFRRRRPPTATLSFARNRRCAFNMPSILRCCATSPSSSTFICPDVLRPRWAAVCPCLGHSFAICSPDSCVCVCVCVDTPRRGAENFSPCAMYNFVRSRAQLHRMLSHKKCTTRRRRRRRRHSVARSRCR